MIEHEGFDLNIDSFRLNELPQTDTHDRHARLTSQKFSVLNLISFHCFLSLGLSSKASWDGAKTNRIWHKQVELFYWLSMASKLVASIWTNCFSISWAHFGKRVPSSSRLECPEELESPREGLRSGTQFLSLSLSLSVTLFIIALHNSERRFARQKWIAIEGKINCCSHCRTQTQRFARRFELD